MCCHDIMSYVSSNFAISCWSTLCGDFEYSPKIVRLKPQLISEQDRPCRCPSCVTHIKLNFWIPLLGGWPLARWWRLAGGGPDFIRKKYYPARDRYTARAVRGGWHGAALGIDNTGTLSRLVNHGISAWTLTRAGDGSGGEGRETRNSGNETSR